MEVEEAAAAEEEAVARAIQLAAATGAAVAAVRAPVGSVDPAVAAPAGMDDHLRRHPLSC